MASRGGNGMLAVVVGLAIIFLGLAFATMVAYGMLASYGALAGTVSFGQAVALTFVTYGLSIPSYILGTSVVKSA